MLAVQHFVGRRGSPRQLHLLVCSTGIKPNLTTLVEGVELNEDQKFKVFHDLEVELVELDQLLADYKEYAERDH